MSDRDELFREAESLGLDFPKNIPGDKLEKMIAAKREELSGTPGENSKTVTNNGEDENEDLDQQDAEFEAEQARIAANIEKEAAEKAEKEAAEAQAKIKTDMDNTKPANSQLMNKKTLMRRKIAEARKKAFKTSIVTLTNKDSRENEVMTTVHLSFENQHFGLSKIVPLDVPVELEKALIDIAESTRITLHKDEIVGGKRTGNKVAVSVKKFAISYSREQTEN